MSPLESGSYMRQTPDSIQHKVCHTRGQNSFLVMLAHQNVIWGKIKPTWNWEQNWVLKKRAVYFYFFWYITKLELTTYQT